MRALLAHVVLRVQYPIPATPTLKAIRYMAERPTASHTTDADNPAPALTPAPTPSAANEGNKSTTGVDVKGEDVQGATARPSYRLCTARR